MTERLPALGTLRRAASELWPELSFRRFRVNDVGWTFRVLDADDRIIFRFPRRRSAAESLGFEVRLLDFLADRLSVPIPEVERIGILERPAGWPFLSYRKLGGSELPEFPTLPREDRVRLRDFVARLLRELAAIPSPPLRRLGCRPGDPAAWLGKYRRMLQRYDRVAAAGAAPDLDRAVRREFRAAFRMFRAARFRAVACHMDLGPFNLLWDARAHRPTGVIDWEDLRLGDPAFDLTGLKFLGDDLLRPIARERREPGDSSFEDRVRFYRWAASLQEMLFAIENRRPALLRRKRTELRRALGLPTRPPGGPVPAVGRRREVVPARP